MDADGKAAELVFRCHCGFEAWATEPELIVIIGEHASEAHNADITDDQVLAMVRTP